MSAEDATGSGATVTLDADTRPWVTALDAVAEKTKEWGQSIRNLLHRATDGLNTERLTQFQDTLRSVAELGANAEGAEAARQMGASVGATAGAALGTALGPIGTVVGGMLGERIGGELAKNLAASGQLQAAAKLIAIPIDAAKEALAGLTDAVDGILGDDLTIMFERIGDVARSLDWTDLINSPLDQAWDKVAGKAGEAWGQVQEFGAKALARIELGIDDVWEKVRQPVAAFANWLQDLAVRFGLLEEGTQSWGDAILSVKDVGKAVVGEIGYGLGYLEGLFMKLGGVITEHLIAPLTIGLAAALKAAADGVAELAKNDKLKLALNTAGINLDGMAEGLDRSAERLFDVGKGLEKQAGEWKNVDPLARAEAGRRNALGWADFGKQALERDRRDPVAEPIVLEDAPPSDPLSSSKAVLADSREAANILARSQVAAGQQQLAALEKIGRNGEEQLKAARELADEVKGLRRDLGDGQVIRAV